MIMIRNYITSGGKYNLHMKKIMNGRRLDKRNKNCKGMGLLSLASGTSRWSTVFPLLFPDIGI
jgi:hypothetical protein